jgi:hypothetical protein
MTASLRRVQADSRVLRLSRILAINWVFPRVGLHEWAVLGARRLPPFGTDSDAAKTNKDPDVLQMIISSMAGKPAPLSEGTSN